MILALNSKQFSAMKDQRNGAVRVSICWSTSTSSMSSFLLTMLVILCLIESSIEYTIKSNNMNIHNGRKKETSVGSMEKPTSRSITTLYVSFVEPPTKNARSDDVEDGRKIFTNVMDEMMRMFTNGEKITESFADTIQSRTFLSNNQNNNRVQDRSVENNTGPVALCSEGDWGAYLDDKKTGVVYYYNTKTRSSQWEKPYDKFPVVVLTNKQQEVSDRLKTSYLETVYGNNLSSAATQDFDWIAFLQNMVSTGMNAVGVIYDNLAASNTEEKSADISNSFTQEQSMSLALLTEGDWEAYLDDEETGFVYYYNTKTQSTQWEKPYENFPTVILTKKEQAISDRLTGAYFQSVYENNLSSITTSNGFNWIEFLKNMLLSGMNTIGMVLDSRDAGNADLTNVQQYALEGSKDSLPLCAEGDWLAYFDDEATGLVYYYNTVAQTSQWEKPYEEFPDVVLTSTQEAISEKLQAAYFQQSNNEEMSTQPVLASEGDWKAYLDCSQQDANLVYYYNELTGQSQWYPPTSTFPTISPHMWLNLMIQNQKPEFVTPVVQDGSWGAFYDYDSSRFFYYNAETGDSQWEIPNPSFPSVFFLTPEPKNQWIESFNTWFQNEAVPWLSSQYNTIVVENKHDQHELNELSTDKNMIHTFVDNTVNEAETWWKSLFYVSDNTNDLAHESTKDQDKLDTKMRTTIEPLSLPSLPSMEDIQSLLNDFNSRFSQQQLRTFSLQSRSSSDDTSVSKSSSPKGFWAFGNTKRTSESSRSESMPTASKVQQQQTPIDKLNMLMNGFSSFELHRLGTFSLSALDRKRKNNMNNAPTKTTTKNGYKK